MRLSRAERIIEKMKRSKSPTCWDGLKPWYNKSAESFAEIIYDTKWELIGVGDAPKGYYAWCAFCGLRVKRFAYLKRLRDGTHFKVGQTCVGRVGLEVTEKTKRLRFIRREPTPVPRKVKEPKEKPLSAEEVLRILGGEGKEKKPKAEDAKDEYCLDEFF
jgi:hypothetical protein